MARVRDMVSVARSGIENLRPAEVRAELDSGEVLLIDVREPTETAEGAIEGAVFVPRGVLEFWGDGLESRRRVILYSSTGLRSALAAQTLQELGYSDVAHLADGLAAWSAAGFPLTS